MTTAEISHSHAMKVLCYNVTVMLTVLALAACDDGDWYASYQQGNEWITVGGPYSSEHECIRLGRSAAESLGMSEVWCAN